MNRRLALHLPLLLLNGSGPSGARLTTRGLGAMRIVVEARPWPWGSDLGPSWPRYPFTGIRIPQVEDHDTRATSWNRVLRQLGAMVMGEATARKAMALAPRADIIRTDVVIAEEDGVWLLDRVNQQPAPFRSSLSAALTRRRCPNWATRRSLARCSSGRSIETGRADRRGDERSPVVIAGRSTSQIWRTSLWGGLRSSRDPEWFGKEFDRRRFLVETDDPSRAAERFGQSVCYRTFSP